MNYKLISSIFFIMLVFSPSVFAQNPAPKATLKPISGGIINGKAISLPKPEYPAAAIAVKAFGEVKVQVLIDEIGNVVSASAISGHPLLRQSAERAAQQAKFSPTKLSGSPVKVSGIIIYNFVPDKSNEEKVKIFGLAVALTLIKNSVWDLDKLGKSLESSDPAKEILDDFPEFARELASLAKLKSFPVNQRYTVVNDAINSINNKLTMPDKWQFELGINFGDIFVMMFESMNNEKEEFDSTKIDATSLKLSLEKIKDLMPSAPPEFPLDVLEKIKQIAELKNGKHLAEPENLLGLFLKITEMIEIISPGTTK